MTLEKLKAALSATGIPVACNVFKSPQKPPYICYIIVGNSNFSADGEVYESSPIVQIELYTSQKSVIDEKKVETALAGMYYEKNEAPLNDDELYMVTYQLTI